MPSIEELQSENEKLKKEIEVKSDLISISAHQLRTSLSALRWLLGMFTDHDMGSIGPEQKNIIEKAVGSSEHMLFLVTTLLTLNHSNAAAIILNPSSVDMAKLLQETMFEFEGFARNMNVTIAPVRGPATTLMTKCDPEMIRIVVSGLVENAIKYSNEGGVVTSEISSNPETHMVEISIHNDGTSINDDAQLKVFSKFFRAPEVVERKISGSGLGLYIAKQIIECHNGNIWFESSLETGTTFFIALPIV